jgi:tetratricopeptide (TPR) repeat protein
LKNLKKLKNLKNRMTRKRSFCAIALPLLFWGVIFLFGSCSSAPKKPAEIFTNRNTAANQLDFANRTANQGRYNDALLILNDARTLAVSADDPVLLIKIALARGNVLFSLGRHEEAFADWEEAGREGESAGEQNLAIQVRIYEARARLMLLIAGNPSQTQNKEKMIEDIRDGVKQQIAALKSDPLGEAAGWIVEGMAEKELRHYGEAESAIRRALAVHEKQLYLEEAAYDWYLIASVRSVQGNYDGAVEALRSAIGFDRRAENGFGLSSSWQALGDVYAKAGNTADSTAAYRRSAAIYRSLGLDDLAEKVEAKLSQN